MNGAGRPCSACSKAGAASSTTTSTTSTTSSSTSTTTSSSTSTTTSSSNQQVRVPELKRKTGQGFETNHQFGDWMHHHRHHGQGGDDGGGTQQSQQSNEGENGMDAATRSCSVQCLSANNEWLLLQRHVARMAIG
jgi:hypothetical protein